MKPTALVVEDDDRIIDQIEDILDSIGHDHVWVTNQQDAQEKLRVEEFAYVLLDLQIPPKPNRGGADKAFGIHLLEFIQNLKGPRQLPVIMMTANSRDCLDLSTELLGKGVSEFISKPFESKGRNLAQIIQKLIAEWQPEPATPQKASQEAKAGRRRQFQGGELVFYPKRVELEEVKICGDERQGKARTILDQLRQKTSRGKYRSFSGDELAKHLGRLNSQNDVYGTIRDIREKVVQVLREEANTEIGKEGLIRSTKSGYCLADWITVRDGDRVPEKPAGHVTNRGPDVPDRVTNRGPDVPDRVTNRGPDVPDRVTNRGPDVPDRVTNRGPDVPDRVTNRRTDRCEGDDSPDHRRQFILAELQNGPVRVSDLADRLKCSPRTVKRDLALLKAEGIIEFDGSPRSGCYKIKA